MTSGLLRLAPKAEWGRDAVTDRTAVGRSWAKDRSGGLKGSASKHLVPSVTSRDRAGFDRDNKPPFFILLHLCEYLWL